jgi:spore photoproduct lyase
MLYNIPMAMANKFLLAKGIGEKLEQVLPIKLGVNKKNELMRLVYEISLAQGLAPEEVIRHSGVEALAEDGKNGLFHKVKRILVEMRYPSLGASSPRIMPLKLKMDPEPCPVWNGEFRPKRIFVENGVFDTPWTGRFTSHFPGVAVEEIEDIKSAIKAVPHGADIETYNRRRDLAIIVKNKDAFTKRCPCTKGALRCGYMILNVGFGCPIDCTYCYLQSYSNIPGIVLPANIEDYYRHIKDLDEKVKTRTRIGTGEFTDSLALDRYTGYSRALIPFFRDSKNLVLELKTKVADIPDVLETEPNENVVISWSINTRSIAEKYEKGSASVSERIEAARAAAARGYKVGFHFDPIVYYPDWENEYSKIVAELFSYDNIRNSTAWVSLGTMRYTPGLKQIAEQRFDDNMMFYQGDFFPGYDGKLRYADRLRADIYGKMRKWIKGSGVKTWVYLCMEPTEMARLEATN